MNINRKIARVLLVALAAASIAGCSRKEEETATSEITLVSETTSAEAEPEEPKQEALPVPDGMYLSEMTGEPIDEELKSQRPIAVMVDNELTALDHYATAEADVVYELMNSTLNDRITRLMCFYKDWKNIEQIGSVRSTRPTNIYLYTEWNAILCHDGGPYYINERFANDYTPHFSGFSRVQNGKQYEYTEYVLKGDVESRLRNSNVTETYDEYRVSGDHFNFSPYGIEINLDELYSDAKPVKTVDLSGAFWHNKSRLEYNEETQTYDYYDYGNLHVDAEDGEPLTFKNLFIQDASFSQLDAGGYMVYNCIADQPQRCYYLTNGYAIECYWVKPAELQHTKYYVYDETGELEELTINTGKSYVTLIPDDTWDEIVLK